MWRIDKASRQTKQTTQANTPDNTHEQKYTRNGQTNVHDRADTQIGNKTQLDG